MFFLILVSLYLHFPFCNYKCDYCNFFVLQKNHPHFQDNLIDEYMKALHKEIDHRNSALGKQTIKTIYLGWWTPLLVGKDHIFGVIDHIKEIRDIESLEELNIELNPDPFEETLDFIKETGKRYPQFHRIRFSFGIQTFDDEILKLSGRSYSYNQLKGYLRSLQPIKQANYCYNFDFIAFGSLSQDILVNNKQWGLSRNTNKLTFFQDFVQSQMADSFSIYMLELFPGSKWHKDNSQFSMNELSSSNWELRIENSKLKQCINPDDDKVMEEYTFLSDIVQSAWYNRYEVSNYALPWKQSIHNMVYRTMQPYLGIGASASGMKAKDWKLIRYTNTTILSDYIKWHYRDEKKTSILTNYDILFETFMLGLRSQWVKNLILYNDILIENVQEKIALYEEEGLLWYHEDNLRLTNEGYNLANRIISELVK